jgi:hypothetical protein
MCAADVTLEAAVGGEDKDARLTSVDGWDTTHMCRDWERVYSWAEDHRASDDRGID